MIKIRSFIFLSILLYFSSCFIFNPSEPVEKYQIRRGDTLSQIAKDNQISLIRLKKLNSIYNENTIRAGAFIVIPKKNFARRRASRRRKNYTENFSLKKLGERTSSLGSVSFYKKKLYWPLRSKAITSKFKPRWGRFHNGLDLSADKGTPIYSAHSGRVVYSAKARGYGNLVIIQNGDLLTLYAHNTRNLVRVSDWVSRKHKIATVGRTGNATGNHLHFETRRLVSNGKYLAFNPLKLF